MARFQAVTLLSLFLAFSAHAKPSSEIYAKMEGSWSSGCHDRDEGNGVLSRRAIYSFDGKTGIYQTESFAAPGCVQASIIASKLVGTEVTAFKTNLPDGGFRYRMFPMTSQQLAFFTQSEVDSRNKDKLCGFNNWAVGIYKNLLAPSSSCKKIASFEKFYNLFADGKTISMNECALGKTPENSTTPCGGQTLFPYPAQTP